MSISTPHAHLTKNITESLVRKQPVAPSVTINAPELNRQRACYVYIYQNPGRRLRALAGHPLPRKDTLAEEIAAHTLSALTSTQYSPIHPVNLKSLVYAVAVLDPLQRISDPTHLDPHHFGLYVCSDQHKAAVVMPGRPGIDTSHDQIATALREADIDTRQEDLTMYRFGVVYYE